MAAVRKKLLIVGDEPKNELRLWNEMLKSQSRESYFQPNGILDLVVNNRPVELYLCHMAGLERYECLRRLLYFNTDIVIICYTIGSHTSLCSVSSKWVPEARNFCPTAAILLVGTSKGRDYDTVEVNAGRTVARAIGAKGFVEYSAASTEEVNKVMEEVCRIISLETSSRVRVHHCAIL